MANNTNYLEIQDAIIVEESEKKHCPFILGNTIEIDMQSLEDDYLVPVFSRDNNQTISHTEFINTVSYPKTGGSPNTTSRFSISHHFLSQPRNPP